MGSSSPTSNAPTSSRCGGSRKPSTSVGRARQGRQDHRRRPRGLLLLGVEPRIRGNLFGGAIIAQPNAGILRMGEIQKRVVVVDVEGQDTMAIHPVMYLALSYDHRIVDGVLGNSFLYRVAEILEKGEFEV